MQACAKWPISSDIRRKINLHAPSKITELIGIISYPFWLRSITIQGEYATKDTKSKLINIMFLQCKFEISFPSYCNTDTRPGSFSNENTALPFGACLPLINAVQIPPTFVLLHLTNGDEI